MSLGVVFSSGLVRLEWSHLFEEISIGGQWMSSPVQASDVFGSDESFSFTGSRIRHNLLSSRYVVTPNIIGRLVSIHYKELRGKEGLYLFSIKLDRLYIKGSHFMAGCQFVLVSQVNLDSRFIVKGIIQKGRGSNKT